MGRSIFVSKLTRMVSASPFLYLGLLLVCGMLLLVKSHPQPQLQFEDQQRVGGEVPLTRVRRRPPSLIQPMPQKQPQVTGSFGHHVPKYIHPNSQGFGGLGASSNSYSNYGDEPGSGISSYGHYNEGGGGGGAGGGGGGGGYQPVGPVFTFVRTDHHGNFQWGVRHKIGAGGWGR